MLGAKPCTSIKLEKFYLLQWSYSRFTKGLSVIRPCPYVGNSPHMIWGFMGKHNATAVLPSPALTPQEGSFLEHSEAKPETHQKTSWEIRGLLQNL